MKCNKCKYYDKECYFFSMGSGNPIDMPCYIEEQTGYWKELKINEAIIEALEKIDITTPTPIQREAIPYLLEGLDCIGQAQTGTGKTFAYSIPLIEKIDSTTPVIAEIIDLLFDYFLDEEDFDDTDGCGDGVATCNGGSASNDGSTGDACGYHRSGVP